MATLVGVPKETADGERRVALVPEVAGRLADRDFRVVVERGAGETAHHADDAYEDAGATVADRAEALGADVVTCVQALPDDDLDQLNDGAALVGLLAPLDEPERARSLAERGVTALAMELVPRISRAQKMDALSAMSSIGGYKAALMAAHKLPRFFPLLTTAAGTIRPATVLVLGAGVAGLQAIATAQRLGAKALAYDIRAAAAEEVESLGAEFVELEFETQKKNEDTGGYAEELQQEKQERQTELLVPHIGNADAVITTALIPGRPAPVLVNEDAVRAMVPGSVIVDLAATGGGNCALTEPGETITRHGVTIMGPRNLPATLPVHASQLYARTVAALIEEFVDAEDGVRADFEDDIFEGACLTHDGEIRNERVRSVLEASAES